jgi:threonine synthase
MCPETWPEISREEIASYANQPYADVAFAIIRRFVGGENRRGLCHLPPSGGDAARTRPAPNHFVLELFHGPTLAFKDVAMQLLARLMDHVLAQRGERATIVGATSGDTGGAAIEAFARPRPHRHLHPVPEWPRLAGAAAADDDGRGRQRPCARVDGTFDDCQAS